MNEDELKGGARYVGGKVEKAIGDAVDSRDWKVDGVVDQVAGGAQHGYGRARSIVEDAVDAAPALADEARDRMKAAAETVRETPALWAVAAGITGYAIAWLVHGRRG